MSESESEEKPETEESEESEWVPFVLPEDPFKPLPVVSLLDPALHESMDLEQYARTRHPSLLRLRPGMVPRVFTIRRITGSQASGLRAAHECFRWEMSAATCCIEVVDAEGRKAPKSKVLEDPQKAKQEDFDKWKQDLLDLAGLDVVEEIGKLGLKMAALPKGQRGPFV